MHPRIFPNAVKLRAEAVLTLDLVLSNPHQTTNYNALYSVIFTVRGRFRCGLLRLLPVLQIEPRNPLKNGFTNFAHGIFTGFLNSTYR